MRGSNDNKPLGSIIGCADVSPRVLCTDNASVTCAYAEALSIGRLIRSYLVCLYVVKQLVRRGGSGFPGAANSSGLGSSRRKRGRTNIGAPQRSPVSSVLFLIWMAPIITKMETALRERFQVKRAEIEIPSYIDDLQSGIYIWEPDVAERCNMRQMLQEADAEVNGIQRITYP